MKDSRDTGGWWMKVEKMICDAWNMMVEEIMNDKCSRKNYEFWVMHVEWCIILERLNRWWRIMNDEWWLIVERLIDAEWQRREWWKIKDGEMIKDGRQADRWQMTEEENMHDEW